MRNAVMLRDYNPRLVVAFPGGKGTENMVQQTERKGIMVMRISASRGPKESC